MGISSDFKSKKMVNKIIYHCAKFGAFFTKRTIPPKKLAMPLHYICICMLRGSTHYCAIIVDFGGIAGWKMRLRPLRFFYVQL